MIKALADRLAEAFAEYLHLEARRDWYEPDAAPTSEELVAESYRGIRPAFGYPACPDHSEKGKLFELLGAGSAGLALTESYAMTPAAARQRPLLRPSGREVLRRRAHSARPGGGLRGAQGRGRAGSRAVAPAEPRLRLRRVRRALERFYASSCAALARPVCLAVPAVALAADTDPKKRITAADQAKARSIVLKRTDFAAGWKKVPASPDSDLVCPGFNPDESDLTLTGEAEADFEHTQGRLFVASVRRSLRRRKTR